MRVVGLLLVSALMIVPVAVAQLLTRSFVTTMRLAIGIGVVACVVGLSATYWWDVSPGAMIVVLTIAAYAVVATLHPVLRGRQGRRDPHPDLPADVVLEG